MKILICCALLVMVLSTAGRASAADAPLPKDYRSWASSRDKVVSDKSSLFYGIHTIYVDARALKTYRYGGVYPEGSRFVVEQFAIKSGGDRPAKGKKSMVVLMRKDRRMNTTGGWYFAGFTPEGKPSGLDPVKNCFGCHARDAAATDFVMSKYSDFK